MVKFLGDFSWKVEGRRTAIQLKVRFIASIFAQWIWSHKTWLVESPQSQELFCFFSRNSILWCNMCFRQSAFWQTLIAWGGWFITWSHKNIPESLEQKYRAAALAVSGPSNVSSSSGLCGSRREGGILRWKERTELWIPDGTEQLPRKNHWFEQGGRYLTNPNNALFFREILQQKHVQLFDFSPKAGSHFVNPLLTRWVLLSEMLKMLQAARMSWLWSVICYTYIQSIIWYSNCHLQVAISSRIS